MGKIVKRFVFRGDKGPVQAEVLFDSGAICSIIRRDVAERLSKHFLKIKGPTLSRVDGQRWVSVTQSVNLAVTLKGKNLDGRFYVIDQMPREVIIGVDFMQTWEIKLDPKHHDFTIGLDPGHMEMA